LKTSSMAATESALRSLLTLAARFVEGVLPLFDDLSLSLSFSRAEVLLGGAEGLCSAQRYLSAAGPDLLFDGEQFSLSISGLGIGGGNFFLPLGSKRQSGQSHVVWFSKNRSIMPINAASDFLVGGILYSGCGLLEVQLIV